ncbi:zinc finger CCCH domain-containing protein 14-like [Acropora millepora]|uniref:zinc finger CCCH domain-containing protein 14-like n=1 Tax=Acropora millepora TaxID=45264 RepID=UPI001CF149B8|nr:zinc finger CCCH domain-containing protein 14-like [Acropora millepora]
MEIGNEISQKIRSTIKTKLKELGSYVDDELPDYIMVMLANKRSKEQMTEDLVLFLGTNTALFTEWLVNIIKKLQDVASLQLEEDAKQKKVLPEQSVLPQVTKAETIKTKEEKEPAPKISSKFRQQSPSRRTDAKDIHSSKSEARIKHKTTSNVVKTVGLSSKGSSRKRKHSSSEEEDSRASQLHSIVKVKDRKPTLPVSKQASGNLLKKAVAAAHHSVNKTGTCITSSLKYDPTSPPSPIRSHSYEEKQQQKELLLQQHRELQKCFLQMKHREEIPEIEMDVAVDGGLEMEEVLGVQENTKEEIDENESRDDDQECQEEENIQEPEAPVIELHVSETDTFEDGVEAAVPGDMRIVAFADSQAGGEYSDEESRKRKKRRRAVKSKKERPSSPKFIVTLDGADSDMEDKYDDQVKKEKKKSRSKKKVETDDFEEIDTSDVKEKLEPEGEMTTPGKPPIKQITFDFGVEGGESEDTSPVKNKQATQDRCKFWPECKNGDSCPFYHPTVTCRSFPNCRFGESCRFIHPPCKFDGRCANSACPYTHKLKNKQQTSPVSAPLSGFMFPSPSVLIPSSPIVPPTPCKFYPSCTKADCPFYHPQPKPCRFGLSCSRPNCSFSHPAKPSSLKWVAPSLHISERRFAMSEQKVTSMPVI